jgi:hypothetical protein
MRTVRTVLPLAQAADPPDDITFNAIVVAESLSSLEMKTGSLLRDYINTLDEAPAKATLVQVASRDAFLALLRDLETQVQTRGLLPVLHLEAHGDENSGICFADDSNLSWDDFCDAMTPLNIATGMRLLVTVAACYGGSLISGIRLSKPAPCFALVGPSHRIDESEVMGSFRDFYGAMLRTLAAGPAIAALRGHTLREGELHVMTARRWFELLMTQYLQTEATPRRVRDFALRHYLNARMESQSTLSMRDYKRLFRRELPVVVRKYFETFFAITDADRHPRYRALWSRLSALLDQIRWSHS